MRADIAAYIRKCKVYNCHKPEQKAPVGFLTRIIFISKPSEAITADIVGPLPRSKHGFVYILVVTDYFSKFIF